MVYVYSVELGTNEKVLTVKQDGKPLVRFKAETDTLGKLLALLMVGKVVIEPLTEGESKETNISIVETTNVEKKEEEEDVVPVYKRPRKDVSPATKNAVLNVVKSLYSDGSLFHVKDILDVIDDISYSVANAALGHLAHEGYLEKVSRGRKVYYRYTGKKKMQKVLR